MNTVLVAKLRISKNSRNTLFEIGLQMFAFHYGKTSVMVIILKEILFQNLK